MGDSRPTEVCMCLCFSRCQALVVIVSQQLIEQVQGLQRDLRLCLRRDESRPWLLGVTEMHAQLASAPSKSRTREGVQMSSLAQQVLDVRLKVDVVFLQIQIKVIGAQDSHNLEQLVIVIASPKEMLPSEILGKRDAIVSVFT